MEIFWIVINIVENDSDTTSSTWCDQMACMSFQIHFVIFVQIWPTRVKQPIFFIP
jgi:hypothetical protein